jgi:hypothetical protein
MQGFKKVLVALLVVMTILGTMGPVFAAPADVQGTKYEDAAVRLMALGIFKGDDKGNFNPDMPITRAEATAIVVRALGLEKSADLMKGVTKFADVNADPGLQWATGAINIAVSNGIINGYPDGRFGGRDNVTYAQLAKMILYALNYGITVEGGVWPTAVLAKADDLGILDDLTVVANAPITRGDAAKMLDNSLDVKSLKQTGYGDLKQFEETGQTLLEKLGIDELEGQVTETALSNTKFKDNELNLRITKVNGEELDKVTTKRFKLLTGAPEAYLGLDVTAWVNDDDEIVFIEVETEESDILYDTVAEDVGTADEKITLKVADDDYKLALEGSDSADDFTAVINFNRGSWNKASDLDAGDYGVFVLEDKEIKFINAFKFDKPEGGVVTSASDDVIEYFLKDDSTKKLRLKDYDNVYVFGPKLERLSVDEIEKDSVIYWFADGTDDLFIIVQGQLVEGTLDRVYNTKVTIDGKDYDVVANKTTVSADDDDTVEVYYNGTTRSSAAKDLVGENVVALLDLNGDVRHLRGEAKSTSGWIYGVVTNAFYDKGDLALKVVTKDGETVTYALEEEGDWSWTDGGTKKSATNFASQKQFYAVAFKLNSDGKIAKGKLTVLGDASKAFVSTFDGKQVTYGVVSKQDDDDDLFYIGSGSSGPHYVASDTVFMRALDEDGDVDPESVDWADLEDKELAADNSDHSTAIVVGDPRRDAKFVLFVEQDFQASSADWYFGVAVTDVSYNGDDDVVTINVCGLGQKEFVTPEDEDLTEGDIVAFRITGSNEMKDLVVIDVQSPPSGYGSVTPVYGTLKSDQAAVYDEVYAVDGTYVKFSQDPTTWVKVDKNAVVYFLKSGYKLDKVGDYTDLDDSTTPKQKVFYVAKNDVIKAIVIIPF